MSRQGPQPTDIRMMIPRRCLPVWVEVRSSIVNRLSPSLDKTTDEIAPSLIVEELLRIAMHHIYVEGYPSPADVKIKQDRQRKQLRDRANMAETIEGLEKRLAALEGREGGADDS